MKSSNKNIKIRFLRPSDVIRATDWATACFYSKKELKKAFDGYRGSDEENVLSHGFIRADSLQPSYIGSAIRDTGWVQPPWTVVRAYERKNG